MKKIFSILLNIIVILSISLGGVFQVHALAPQQPAAAAPTSPTDQTQVPHYFGPYPNWANSPLTLPDATVTITGNGSGAQAVATVGAGGAITAIDVTNPGSNYSSAKVDITGAGTGASASANIIKKGAVVSIALNLPGAGYTAPTVSFSGGGSGSGAAATAYGGVDNVTIISGGSGYTFPTVEFDLPDDPAGVQAKGHANMDVNGAITDVVVDSAGSGYLNAPGVSILNGTRFDPIAFANNGGPASASATLALASIVVDSTGANYTQVPTVNINDLTGSGATATAALDNGVIASITITKAGSGYVTPGGIRKFVDTLPGLGPTGANNLGQYLPVAVPDTTTFPGTDYYVIAVVQHREKMHSDLPPTLLREYVQLSTSVVKGAQVPLMTDLKGGGQAPVMMPDGITPAIGVDTPHFLGPVIVAQKDKAVRIVFYNLLPTGSEGDLFLPTDSSVMGSGDGPMAMPAPVNNNTVLDEVRNPMCSQYPKDPMCYQDNRATLHLHGGTTPWISDGTPHQWITPANENTSWPQGVSVANVPDMISAQAQAAGVPDCSAPNDGCQTFYYTNQQSARLMFYHDHAWGITRLNVYAGEAAGYLIQDPVEQNLVSKGIIPSDQIPLIIQDRTFVPSAAQLAQEDPTWNAARWGGFGNLWYHHVYMPAQNPNDPSGMSSFGRWFYGSWFWPPATPTYGPIPNPYFNMDPSTNFTTPLAKPCSLDDPTTWQYQSDPFCEPPLIPGTPNISVGMEQFNDTPIVNGTAYPTTTVAPKSYRLRILNAANDRFWNLQWYVADASGTEVALKASDLAAAQTDPNVFPTPDTSLSPVGPSWIQIGTEGGFLPAPAVIPNQPITWITDPTRFDWGNVDKHALLLAPAERADVIVDFSKYAGKTLILYNDAPAAFPGRISSYDYYTGGPDLSPAGAPSTLPGYGPNTRTIMQVKVSATTPAAAFNMTALNAAFRHHADGSGVFESGQHPIIVGQSAYNSAYGTSFASAAWCNSPTNPSAKCDGFARIAEQGGTPFKFDTLKGKQVSIPLEAKALHDEMNSAAFDEFGRMTANLGLEAVPASPNTQNILLYPYIASPTELIDGTNLPKGDVNITPITAPDGSQVWKITHNGVDTHPIHFHLYDVQVLNRVTWDNIIIPPDTNELGWKDTVRISPLEDTIVALRPIIPSLPFDIPNSVRELSPMMPDGTDLMTGTTLLFDPQGNQLNNMPNHLVNFGWEYVYHCHILSHEEMDMMRPVLLALPPRAPINVSFDAINNILSFTDNSLSETSFVVEKSTDFGLTWSQLGTIDRPLNLLNTTGGLLTMADGAHALGDMYRVAALNLVGDAAIKGFPTITTKSAYAYETSPAPLPPTNLVASLVNGPKVNLTWTDNSNNETGFLVERSIDNGATFSFLVNLGPNTTSYTDTTVLAGGTYVYRVAATGASNSAFAISNLVSVPTKPADPTLLAATAFSATQVDLTWTDNASNEDGYMVMRSSDGGATWTKVGQTAAFIANPATFSDTTAVPVTTYVYQVIAFNVSGSSNPATSNAVTTPDTVPVAPTSLAAVLQTGPQVSLTWKDNSSNENNFELERSINGGAFTLLNSLPANTTTYLDAAVSSGNIYAYRVRAVNTAGPSAYAISASVYVPTIPADPTNLTAIAFSATQVDLTWTDNASIPNNEDGYMIMRSSDGGATWANIGQTAAFSTNPATFSDMTAQPLTTYVYQVYAFNIMGNSNSVISNSVTTTGLLPAAPTNLVAVLQVGPQVSLSWVDNANNETGFELERSTDGVNFSLLASPAANSISYLDNTVLTGTTYTYRVRAVNTAGPSAYATSNSVYVLSKPADPTNLVAAAFSATQVNLTWLDNATTPNNEDGYVIKRSIDGGATYTQIGQTGPNATSYSDTSAAPVTTYMYQVYGFNLMGNSNPATSNSVTTPDVLPAAPSNLAAVLQAGPQVSLSWTDNSNNEAAFELERSVNGGAFALLISQPSNTTSYVDTAVVASTTYAYRVRAVNTAGSSAYSNTVSLTVAVPARPTGLAATNITQTSLTLSWTDNSNNEAGFYVQISPNQGFTGGVQTFTVPANTISYAFSGLTANTRYYLRVQAFNNLGTSQWSPTLSVRTLR